MRTLLWSHIHTAPETNTPMRPRVRRITYHSAGLVVVQVHLLAQVAAALAGVDKVARELEAEADVVGAAAPLPVADAGHLAGRRHLRRLAVVAVVAGARLDGALGAGARNRVGDRRTGDGVQEGGLAAACGTENWK